MKTFNAMICAFVVLSSVQSFAAKIDLDATIKVRECSSYVFASPAVHKASAIHNYRAEASEKCLEKGYTDWVSLDYESSPGLDVPVYCIKGTVLCQ